MARKEYWTGVALPVLLASVVMLPIAPQLARAQASLKQFRVGVQVASFTTGGRSSTAGAEGAQIFESCIKGALRSLGDTLIVNVNDDKDFHLQIFLHEMRVDTAYVSQVVGYSVTVSASRVFEMKYRSIYSLLSKRDRLGMDKNSDIALSVDVAYFWVVGPFDHACKQTIATFDSAVLDKFRNVGLK